MSNSKSKIWVWGLLVLIVINVSALITIGANTWVFKDGKRDRTERHLMRDRSPFGVIKERLDLTDVQKEQFEEIQQVSRKEMRELFSEMSDFRNHLNTEFSRYQLDMSKINDLNEEIVDTDRKIRHSATEIHVKMRKILNEDQVKIFIKEMSRRGKRSRPPMGFISE